jgi:hypothetical protein
MKKRSKSTFLAKPGQTKPRLVSLTPEEIYEVFRASGERHSPTLDECILAELELNRQRNGSTDEIYELFMEHEDSPVRDLDNWILGELGHDFSRS